MSTSPIEYGAKAEAANAALPPDKVKVPSPPRPQRPPISVNGVEISHAAISAEAQPHPAGAPAEAFRDGAGALVLRELLLSEARASGIAPQPQSDDRGRRETDDDAMIRQLLDQEVTTPKADAAACRRYYEKNRARFTTGRIFEARHILLAAPVGDTAARAKAREQAAALIHELTADRSKFADMAHTFSACPSREQGGNLGQLTRGSTVPEFETVLNQLMPGQLWPVPVPTQFGYHVIELERRIEGNQLPFDMVHDRVAAYLEAQSWSRAVAQFISMLMNGAVITGIDIEPAA